MPSVTQRLSAHREPTTVRMVVQCPAHASTLREGPALSDGSGAGWLVFLCRVHAEDLPEWAGVATHTDRASTPCGSVMDFRPVEQVLRSHANLWLTSLTGVCADAGDGVWTDVLAEAERVLRARLTRAGAEDSPLQSIAMMIGLARRSAELGDLGQVASSLGYCEMLTLGLEPWREDGRTPRARADSDAVGPRILGFFTHD
ncbi:hypothetical protein [Streptomyces adustus]|uniref:hypothetical protein n=1 Tax=Streptomyces adustus TaxID=1609272 RepID=UPI00192E3736|nr:hypothetical protein [Streptomyces adustus]